MRADRQTISQTNRPTHQNTLYRSYCSGSCTLYIAAVGAVVVQVVHLPGKGVGDGLELDSGEQSNFATRLETGERAVADVAEHRPDSVHPPVDVVQRQTHPPQHLVVMHTDQSVCIVHHSRRDSLNEFDVILLRF